MSETRAARLEKALKAVLPYVCVQPIPCRGWKCREDWCPSCYGEEEADAAVLRICRLVKAAHEALSTPPEATLAPPTPEPERPVERCVWRVGSLGSSSACGARIAFNRLDITLVGRFHKCPYCGKPLSVEENTQ